MTTIDERRPSTGSWDWPVSWPGILAGAFSGLAVLMLLAAFWAAIASDWTFASDNFKWFQMGSALFAWLVAGFVTGWYASRASTAAGAVRGAGHGFIVWAVVVVVRTVIGIPSAIAPIGFALATASGAPMWASFGAIAGGLITSMIGGSLGGAARSATIETSTSDWDADVHDVRRSPEDSAGPVARPAPSATMQPRPGNQVSGQPVHH